MSVNMTSMETCTGEFLDLVAPDPQLISIEVIAHHLAQINRYVGASRFPISVAEHSLLVSDWLAAGDYPPRVQLLGLLHDAHEAFMGDLSRPLAATLDAMMPGVRTVLGNLKRKLDEAIYIALNIVPPTDAERAAVKMADNVALMTEASEAMESQGLTWGIDVAAWEDAAIEQGERGGEFLIRYYQLKEAAK